MLVAKDAPKRPALRYYGGKWRLAPWIISHFPEHKSYVEPCGGVASVLLQKPRSPLETYNDLDGNVVNFFRVLRDRPDELIRKIRLTPWARAEYEMSLEPTLNGLSDLEQARRFWISLQMSIGASGGQSSFRLIKTADQIHSHPDLYDKDLASLNYAYNRFAGVQIENLDALNCIEKYDGENTLIYFDPPYIAGERSHKNEYAFEWSNDDHVKAADILCQVQGYVVVSGYACLFYETLYESYGWRRFDKKSQTTSGEHRIESIWLSPRTVEALNKPQQLSLLEGESDD